MYREKRYAQFGRRDVGDGPGHEGKAESSSYAPTLDFHGRTSLCLSCSTDWMLIRMRKKESPIHSGSMSLRIRFAGTPAHGRTSRGRRWPARVSGLLMQESDSA